MSTIWTEIDDGLIECLIHSERFRLHGGTCTACVEEVVGAVEFMPVTITVQVAIPYHEEGSHV